jgi:hypothetical protein
VEVSYVERCRCDLIGGGYVARSTGYIVLLTDIDLRQVTQELAVLTFLREQSSYVVALNLSRVRKAKTLGSAAGTSP